MEKAIDQFERALNLWKIQSPDLDLDPQWIELIKSRAFNMVHMMAEQVVMVIDHRSLSYKYISGNFESIMGLSSKLAYEGGLAYNLGRIHPDDVAAFEVITSTIIGRIRSLTPEEVLDCRLSFNYRFQFGDNKFHHILQHNIPIEVDESSNILQVIAIVSDITLFKRNNQCNYQVVQYSGRKKTSLVEGTAITINPDEQLSNREREIIDLTAQGLKESEIASRLDLSIYTVKTHRKNLFRKTGTRNAAELVMYAASNLLI